MNDSTVMPAGQLWKMNSRFFSLSIYYTAYYYYLYC